MPATCRLGPALHRAARPPRVTCFLLPPRLCAAGLPIVPAVLLAAGAWLGHPAMSLLWVQAITTATGATAHTACVWVLFVFLLGLRHHRQSPWRRTGVGQSAREKVFMLARVCLRTLRHTEPPRLHCCVCRPLCMPCTMCCSSSTAVNRACSQPGSTCTRCAAGSSRRRPAPTGGSLLSQVLGPSRRDCTYASPLRTV